MQGNKLNIFLWLLIFIGLQSANQWSEFPIGNTYTEWIASTIILLLGNYISKKQNIQYGKKNYLPVVLFLCWAVIGAIRGAYVAENYWEYKNLVYGVFASSLPFFVYIFASPLVVGKFYRLWIRVCLPLFFVFFFWVITPGEVNFYLAPIFVLGCFMPLMPKGWRFVIVALLAFMLVVDFSARSQVLKAAFAFAMSGACLLHRFIRTSWLRIAHWTIYAATVILLVLGATGRFNIFTDVTPNEKIVSHKTQAGEIREENVYSDTRTFIYFEVFASAIRNDYLIFGRTLARGNDSAFFGAFLGDDLKTGKYERHSNELLHLNILTWLGLVGVSLYSLIYIRGSWLAVYRSKNFYVKLMGIFVAFHWAYGWVEDLNRLDIQNIALWSVIAMSYSSKFRAMTDAEFCAWFRGLFISR